MTQNISIKNIYYMLTYAFQVLKEQSYQKLATENFGNIGELYAEILTKGVSLLIKRGINKDYLNQSESLYLIRGRINIAESIKTMSYMKKRLICEYDVFSENSYQNRIIKTVLERLIHSNIAGKFKKELRKIISLFASIDTLDIYRIKWNTNYNRNNQHYTMLLYICYMFVKSLLLTKSNGNRKLMDYIDEQTMCHLYEKFILKYYQKEFPKISVKASKIPWAVENLNANLVFLPDMQSDIMLTKNDKVLIIDAKYYSQSTAKNYDKDRLHSSNLYQIFTYVKNKVYESPNSEVSGMLLYAKTDDSKLTETLHYKISGNDFYVRTLDLNCDFEIIKNQLNDIAKLVE